ncbi:3-oxoacyl-[acyl-carrier-protein] reductase [Candidatus Aerophobetes bacterium]|uniref:3-oxoacyl-[acyl-carrier-protein] reductase n=1 Tax=Aerophobetes bacterium TaxID=2030807 RepID=A0A662DIY3_UNCAE|nr:MAG: 3-oxoacyl-[acyl-carrier-protein] reductase [Candidatus Aerophobetes bacterium]
MKLKDEIAVVTGGAQGIGKAICRRFIECGAKVAVFDIVEDTTCIAELTHIGQKKSDVTFFKVDVSNLSNVEKAVNQVIDKFSHIDILVNNAGITCDKLILRMREEEWDRVIQINLKGAFNCIKAVSPFMLRRRKGRIINISSIIALRGNAGQSNYAASKAGLIGLTKSLAREFATRGITVNAIAPGFIQTKMTEKLIEKGQAQTLISQIPLGRVGTPEEVASLVTYLASEEASYITGEVIRIDGGLSM